MMKGDHIDRRTSMRVQNAPHFIHFFRIGTRLDGRMITCMHIVGLVILELLGFLVPLLCFLPIFLSGDPLSVDTVQR